MCGSVGCRGIILNYDNQPAQSVVWVVVPNRTSTYVVICQDGGASIKQHTASEAIVDVAAADAAPAHIEQGNRIVTGARGGVVAHHHPMNGRVIGLPELRPAPGRGEARRQTRRGRQRALAHAAVREEDRRQPAT